MIPSLFWVSFKKKSLFAWLGLAFVLGALAIFAYTVTPLNALRYLRGELAEFFLVLGYPGDSNLPLFVFSVLYGFLLPLLSLVLGLSQARRLVKDALDSGQMAMLLAAGHRRFIILSTLFKVGLLWGSLLVVFAFLGQLALVPIFFPGADLAALMRLALGFLPVSLINPAFAMMVASMSYHPRALKRAQIVLVLMLLLAMASRLNNLQALRYFTFWSLFDGQALLNASGGLLGALIALTICAVMALISLVAFSRREI